MVRDLAPVRLHSCTWAYATVHAGSALHFRIYRGKFIASTVVNLLHIRVVEKRVRILTRTMALKSIDAAPGAEDEGPAGFISPSFESSQRTRVRVTPKVHHAPRGTEELHVDDRNPVCSTCMSSI